MYLLRLLRPMLENLLQASANSEVSSRERALDKERKRLMTALQVQERECETACARLQDTVDELQGAIKQLNTFIEARDRRIDSLEHEREILKQDIRGMAMVNERALKYVQSIRTAEESPTSPEMLRDQLGDIGDIKPWPTTS